MTLLPADVASNTHRLKSKWVLVTGGDVGQGRSALAAVRALAAAGYFPAVTVSGDHVLAAASRYCARKVPVPPASAPAYADAVRTEIARGGYVGALPASDAAIMALGLRAAGLLDKDELARRSQRVGLPTIEGQVLTSTAALREISHSLPYPIVVKSAYIHPRRPKLAAIRLDDASAIGSLPDDAGPMLVQPFVTDPMTSISGVVWGGRLVASVHQRYERTWPTPCGTASAAMSIEPDLSVEQRLLRLLRDYDGIFQAQFIGKYIIDVNPRVYGSLPLAVAASANLPAIMCELVLGREVPMVRGKTGVRYRWLEGDVRHITAATRAGKLPLRYLARAMLPARGTAHSVASIKDPLPMAARLAYVKSKQAR